VDNFESVFGIVTTYSSTSFSEVWSR